MDIVPWRPLRELGPLRREMDNLWNRFFGETSIPSVFSQEWVPTVDVSETKDKVVVKAEIPGMEAKDMDVSVSEDVLTIAGEFFVPVCVSDVKDAQTLLALFEVDSNYGRWHEEVTASQDGFVTGAIPGRGLKISFLLPLGRPKPSASSGRTCISGVNLPACRCTPVVSPNST